MIGHIDEARAEPIISQPAFHCRGWAYSENGIASVRIIIDDQDAGQAEYGLPRIDVKKVYPNDTGIEKSGFSFSKNLPLSKGSHLLRVEVLEKNGNKKDLGSMKFKVSGSKGIKSRIPSFLTRFFNKTIQGGSANETRKRISVRYIKGNGIEIGALHNPLITSDEARVKFVDRFPSAAIQKHYAELNPHSMVNIDIVDDGETLSTITDSSLDFIIANHFLEHCENPIGTIRNHLKKIRNGGILYYAIPEKTYTFDKERLLTEFSHLIEDDTSGPVTSRKKHYLEWVRFVDKKQDPAETDARVLELLEMSYSIHFHVWDLATGFQFIYKTNEYLDNPFVVLHFEKNENEIITVLQKK